MNPHAAYWNQGIDNVPAMTGAATLMDGADLKEHAEKLGFSLPFASLLDVGCGTGRLRQFVQAVDGLVAYRGVDVAADAIAYCHAHGVPVHDAAVIARPRDIGMWADPFHWIACLSVFTHIDRDERQAYLAAFAKATCQPAANGRTSNLLVDIIPGDGSGDVALWTAEPAQFDADLAATGWHIVATYDRQCPSGPTHRYYRCERAG